MEPPSSCHSTGRDPLETQKATRRWLSLFRNSISHAERRVFRIYRSFAREFSRAATTKAPALLQGLCVDWVPGGDLLSHGRSHTTIGAVAFHF